MKTTKNIALIFGFSLLSGMAQIPYSVADNTAFSIKAPSKTGKRFSAPGHSTAGDGSCGSHSSISAALDQCGKKGFISALCKKKNGKWTCLPSEDKTNPNVRFTGAARQ